MSVYCFVMVKGKDERSRSCCSKVTVVSRRLHLCFTVNWNSSEINIEFVICGLTLSGYLMFSRRALLLIPLLLFLHKVQGHITLGCVDPRLTHWVLHIFTPCNWQSCVKFHFNCIRPGSSYLRKHYMWTNQCATCGPKERLLYTPLKHLF